MKKLAVVLALLFSIPFVVHAERPTPEEAFKVINYYQKGRGQGAVLMQLKLCPVVFPEGPDKNECEVEITNGIVGKGQKVYLWMNFLVPTDDVAEILIEYKRKNRIRKVQDLSIPSATRYRLWKSIPTNKTGDWEIKVIQENESEDIILGSIKYKVVEDPQE